MHNRFQTWGEFLEFAENRKAVSADPDYQRSHDTSGSYPEFCRTRDFAHALELARYGWPEGVAAAKPLTDALFDKVTSLVEREEVLHDVVGSSIDIGAYLNGDPECWTRMESHIVDGNSPRIFRLVYNASASAGITPDTMIGKGAAIAALVKALEFAGHRVEVWCIPWAGSSHKYGSGRPEHETRVLVKAADQDLDFGRLVFALAHPSTVRRLGFACLEADRTIKTLGKGYGRPADCEESERGDIYIGRSFYGEPQWTDAQSVIAWILETLKTQGVTVRTE